MLITTKEAAEILNVSIRRVQKMLQTTNYQAKFKARKVGRDWMLDKRAVERTAQEDRPAGRPIDA